MGVGLGQRGRDPTQPRGEHHRAGDVASGAEHDIRTPPGEDPGARNGARSARTRARRSANPGRRGNPEIENVSSS